MTASRVSSDASTAFHTALSSTQTANTGFVSANGSGRQQQPGAGTNGGNAWGYNHNNNSNNHGQLTESAMQAIATTFRERSNIPAASRTPSASSSYASSLTHAANASASANAAAPASSYAYMASQRQAPSTSSHGSQEGSSHYQYYNAKSSVAGSRQSSSGWLGSANVGGSAPRRNASVYEDASSSSGSSSGNGRTNYRSATFNGSSSQSGRSGSESDAFRSRGLAESGAEGTSGHISSRSSVRSATSVESLPPINGGLGGIAAVNGAGAGAGNHGFLPTYQAGDTVRMPAPSTSGWEEAFKASSSSKKRAQDEEELAAGIEALGMTPDLKEKNPPRYIPSTLPPPTSEKAWTFKEQIQIPKGKIVDPLSLRGPSEEYFRIAGLGSDRVALTALHGQKPKLIVLDLNQTLVTRKKSTTQASRNATPRPFLSAFLEYICGSDEIRDGVFQRRFNVMVWSSAEGPNVKTMCENIGLLAHAGGQAPLLVDVWDRSSMDLTQAQYDSKFPTIKDLSKIWKSVKWTPISNVTDESDGSGYAPSVVDSDAQSTSGSSVHSSSRHVPPRAPSVVSSASGTTTSNTSRSRKDLLWSQYDTILIDDSPSKAALQPYNHLSVPSWKPQTKPAQFAEPSTYGFNAPSTASNDIHGRLDTCLLQLVGMLERLRVHTNVSSVIATQNYNVFGDSERAAAWRDQGLTTLRNLGIRANHDYDSGWAMRALVQAVPPQPDGTPARLTSPIATGPGIGWD